MNADTVAHECAHLIKFLLRLSKRNDKGLHPVTPVSYILRLHLPAIAFACDCNCTAGCSFFAGQLECPFATLFDDDECQQTLESLMGTLKAAKKRGIIMFEGQLLLKGSHDKVIVSLACYTLNPQSSKRLTLDPLLS